MNHTYTLRSRFINILNESLKKLAILDNIEIVKNPIMEADGNFTSVIKTNDTFDPNKVNMNVDVEEKDSEEKLEDKTELLNKFKTSFKQSLEANEELQKILKKIDDLNKDEDLNEWKLNEQGNTATLRNKNARIFKQNNNLCVSYNDKIEIFKTVEELHKWLKEHNFPLPQNIQLHESVEVKESGLGRWDSIINKKTVSGLSIGDKIEYDPEKEREEKYKRMTKPVTKMGQAEYKDAMKWLDKKKDKVQKKIKGLDEETEVEECFGGVGATTSTLGAVVQYNGEKKEDLQENDETLVEKVFGFPGTPFEKNVYRDKYYRAKEYLDWINTQDEKGNYNLDPNEEENVKTAIQDYEALQLNDRGNKHWNGKFVTQNDPDQLFRGAFDLKTGEQLISKEALIKKIEEINKRYGLELTPNEPVVSLGNTKIGKKNAEQRNKWINDYYKNNRFQNIKFGRKARVAKNKEAYNNYLQNPDYKDGMPEEFKTNKPLLATYKNLISLHDTIEADKFFGKLMEERNKLSPKQFNALLDGLLYAYDNNEIDANDMVVNMWKTLKYNNVEESAKKFNDFHNKFITNITSTENDQQILTEDDKPEDFATNLGGTTDTGTNTTSQTSKIDSTATDSSPDIDFTADDGSTAPESNFGDINVNVGGDYGPDDGGEDIEGGMTAVPEPEYRVIDVMVNDENESEVKVKLQNIETGEIEIKNLNEIDV